MKKLISKTPTNVIIRKASLKDLTALMKLSAEGSDYHHQLDPYMASAKQSGDSFAKEMRKQVTKRDRLTLIIEYKNKPVGYFTALVTQKRSRNPSMIGHIGSIYIQKSYRNKGYGRLAMKELIGWFKKKKVKNVELMVHSKNKVGLSAWQHYGFTEFMKRMRLKI